MPDVPRLRLLGRDLRRPDRDGSGASRSDDLRLQGLSDAPRSQTSMDVVDALDALSLEGDDDVPRTDSGGSGGSIGEELHDLDPQSGV